MIEPGGAARHAPSPTCAVCGSAISYFDSLQTSFGEHGVCRAFDCARIMQRKSSMPPSAFAQHLAFHRNLIAQSRAGIAERNDRVADIEQAQSAENARVLQNMLSANAALPAADTHVLRLPSGRMASTALPLARVENYTRHLIDIIETAFADREDEAPQTSLADDHNSAAHTQMLATKAVFRSEPALHRLSDQACAMCKGGCCSEAGDTAYLTVYSIKKLLAAKPGVTRLEILTTYLSHLRSVTLDGACINQTHGGCSLPRNLRADLCNSFYCEPVKRMQEVRAETTGSMAVVAIQRRAGYWNRIDPRVSNPIVAVALLDESSDDAQAIEGESL